MNAETFPTPAPAVDRRTLLAAAAVLVAALAASYAPNLRDLAIKWEEPNYSHGYLVVPIAAVVLWQRRRELDPARLRPSLVGGAALLALLAVRVWLFERNEPWIEAATIPLAAMALALALGGWHLLLWALPGLAFLWFMLPLPPRLNIVLAGPLQDLATRGSEASLGLLGLPVLREGYVLLIGSQRLEVAQACNGLSMLLSFVTLITATAILARSRPLWERIVLLLSTVPIALASNIIRITATALCYQWFGQERGERYVHDTAGLAMMLIGLALAMMELRLLSWLIVAEEVEERPRLLLPPSAGYAPARPAKPKPAGPSRDNGLADGELGPRPEA